MSYSDSLTLDSVESNLLVVLKPKRKLDGFAQHGIDPYSASFDYGVVTEVKVIISNVVVTLTQATSKVALPDNQWFYDEDAQTLYVAVTGGGDPGAAYVAYEIYASTQPSNWYRDPLDSTTSQVHYPPILNSSPALKTYFDQSLFGFVPVGTSQIVLINAEQELNRHLYSSSFSKAEVAVYHWLGDLKSGNISLIAKMVGGNVTSTDQLVTIDVYSRGDLFLSSYRNRNQANGIYFNTTDDPYVDPNYLGKAKRTIYGYLRGAMLVCHSVGQIVAPDTQDCRYWYVENQADENIIDMMVTNTGSNTTTRTYVTAGARGSLLMMRVGDRVRLLRAAGGEERPLVTQVNVSDGYIEHDAIGSKMASGLDQLQRACFSSLHLVKDGLSHELLYGRDYGIATAVAGDPMRIHIADGLETTFLLATALNANDVIYGHTYGSGTPDYSEANKSNIVESLRDVLDLAGVEDSDLDTTSFDLFDNASFDRLGFSVPATWSDDYPEYSSVITSLLSTGLLRLSLNSESKWYLSALGPNTGSVAEATEEEIIGGTFNYKFDYADLATTVKVAYDTAEYDDVNLVSGVNSKYVTFDNLEASAMHGVERTFSFDCVFNNSTDANRLAKRLAYILGDRRGEISMQLRREFLTLDVDSEVDVSRERLPGFEFISGTQNTRTFRVQGFEKSKDVVAITVDDFKGIADHDSDWG